MARTAHRSLRKVSGGRYRSYRTKRKFELAGLPIMTKLYFEKKVLGLRTLGGHEKRALLSAKEINVTDKNGKTTKTEMVNVVENPANPNLVRRNVITKGGVVETKLGEGRVPRRAGQEGVVNGILV